MRRRSLLHTFNAQFFALSIGMLLSICNTTQANETIVSNINRIAVNGYEAVNSYYNFGANIGDKSLLSNISQSVSEMEASIKSLKAASTDQDIAAEIKKLDENYTTFSTLVRTNVEYVQENGYPDLRLSDDLARSNKSFVEDLATFREKILTMSDYQPNSEAESCRQVALTLANLMTKYSARSTSSVSQVFQGSETEQPIAEIVSQVDNAISGLQSSSKNNAETKKLLNSTSTKWKFVKRSYLNYNEKNVNYVINLYTQKMIQDMKEAELAFLGN